MRSLVLLFACAILPQCTTPSQTDDESMTVESLDMEPPDDREEIATSEDSEDMRLEDEPDSPHNNQEDSLMPANIEALEVHKLPKSLATEAENPLDSADTADESDRYEINTLVLNIRSSANPHSKIVGKIYRGQIVHILEMKGEWAKIGNNQWVHRNFLIHKK